MGWRVANILNKHTISTRLALNLQPPEIFWWFIFYGGHMANIAKTLDEHAFNARFGEFMRRAREMMGISQKELGRRTGITFQQIQKYESGKSAVSVFRMYQISRALELSLLAFFENDFPVAPCQVLDGARVRDLLNELSGAVRALRQELF